MKRNRSTGKNPKYTNFFSNIKGMFEEDENLEVEQQKSGRKKRGRSKKAIDYKEEFIKSGNRLNPKLQESDNDMDEAFPENSPTSKEHNERRNSNRDRNLNKKSKKEKNKNIELVTPSKIDFNQLLNIKINNKHRPKDEANLIHEPLISNSKLIKDAKDLSILDKPLPIPSFRPFDIYEQLDFSDPELAYHTPPIFIRPKGHYLRANELIPESNLAVEYDLDLEDMCWLKHIVEKVGINIAFEDVEEAFETYMDRIEKKWFDYTRKSGKHHNVRLSEPNPDAPCEICTETDCENSNAILFCDGCDLAVHQDCYGVPYIPEGQWLCRKCMLSPSNPVSCVFCPNEGGAFKQTALNSWAHVICTLWIPEVSFGNVVYVEPVEGIEKIPPGRWDLLCYLCKQRTGACIQCSARTCSTAFHVTCAYIAKFSMKYNFTKDKVSMKSYCHKHALKGDKGHIDIKEIQLEFTKKFESKKNLNDYEGNNDMINGSKAALAHQQSFSAPQALIPFHVYQNVLGTETKIPYKKKAQMLTEICKYWSLKKESCRGAPLIKRLHLEPWTASTPLQSEEEKASTYENLIRLKASLEKVQMISSLVRQREAIKLEINKMRHIYWENYFFPYTKYYRSILGTLIEMDKTFIFTQPVSETDVPDYYKHITNPMDFATLSALVDNHQIYDFEEFKDNLLLIFANCMFYNDTFTIFHKKAIQFKKVALKLLNNAKKDIKNIKINKKTGILNANVDFDAMFSNLIKKSIYEIDEIEEENIEVLENDTPISKGSDKGYLLELGEDNNTSHELCDLFKAKTEDKESSIKGSNSISLKNEVVNSTCEADVNVDSINEDISIIKDGELVIGTMSNRRVNSNSKKLHRLKIEPQHNKIVNGLNDLLNISDDSPLSNITSLESDLASQLSNPNESNISSKNYTLNNDFKGEQDLKLTIKEDKILNYDLNIDHANFIKTNLSNQVPTTSKLPIKSILNPNKDDEKLESTKKVIEKDKYFDNGVNQDQNVIEISDSTEFNVIINNNKINNQNSNLESNVKGEHNKNGLNHENEVNIELSNGESNNKDGNESMKPKEGNIKNAFKMIQRKPMVLISKSKKQYINKAPSKTIQMNKNKNKNKNKNNNNQNKTTHSILNFLQPSRTLRSHNQHVPTRPSRKVKPPERFSP